MLITFNVCGIILHLQYVSYHCMYIQTAEKIIIRNTEGKKKNCNQWDKLTIFKNNLLVFMYKEKIK